jgi:hypothetical protein
MPVAHWFFAGNADSLRNSQPDSFWRTMRELGGKGIVYQKRSECAIMEQMPDLPRIRRPAETHKSQSHCGREPN